MKQDISFDIEDKLTNSLFIRWVLHHNQNNLNEATLRKVATKLTGRVCLLYELCLACSFTFPLLCFIKQQHEQATVERWIAFTKLTQVNHLLYFWLKVK